MKQVFSISIKNFIRQLVYRIYCVYQRFLASRIPVYDLQTIDIIKKLPADGVCIDIGANEGQLLHYMLKQCRKGKVMAIESIPILAAALQRKYRKRNVVFREMALSDENGERTFFYNYKRKALSGLHPRHLNRQYCREIKVKVSQLDEVFRDDRLDFIKIDVEGAEYNILKGGLETLARHKPIIVFESGLGGLEFYRHTPQDLYQLLRSVNYHMSTLQNYLNNRPPFSREEFIQNFSKGYDYQYVAYQASN